MYDELINDLKKLKSHEIRSRTPDFFELVVRKENLGELTSLLDGFYGPAMKPAGKPVTDKVHLLSEPYGGIWQNQTFYYREAGEVSYFAMLWPWSDGLTITAKIFKKEKKNR